MQWDTFNNEEDWQQKKATHTAFHHWATASLGKFSNMFMILTHKFSHSNTNKTYCPSPDYCNRTCGVENTQLVAKIAGYENVSTNEDEIAAYLVNHGPLSVGLNAIWLQFYSSGISDPYYCPDDIDHAVLLVGYGVHTNILGEKTPYWIVKNSWGESWGEK